MKRVGLTGGIGSGKSVVAQLLKTYGVPVYDSDLRSKELCCTDTELRDGLLKLYGQEVYLPDGNLNRAFMSKAMFGNQSLLEASNKLIHPVVAKDFMTWALAQKVAIVVQESAIIFEAKLEHLFDFIVCVTAPLDLRVKRVCDRNALTPEQVMERIQRQLPEKECVRRANFIVQNDGQKPLIPQLEALLNALG
jgi:dephospho-CoA kinase